MDASSSEGRSEGRSRTKELPSDEGPRIVSVEPFQNLRFDNKQTKAKFTLTNLTPETIAYKIKSTHHEHYVVKPNAEFIRPNETKEVYVSKIQPATSVSKHRFVLQAMVCPPGAWEEQLSGRHAVWEGCVSSEIQTICFGVKASAAAKDKTVSTDTLLGVEKNRIILALFLAWLITTAALFYK